VIVVWSLLELQPLLDALAITRPALVASPRVAELVPIEFASHWNEIPSDRVAVPAEADGLLAIGGGSAIDTAKAASAATGLLLVSVPTTYSGAEWTPTFGIRSPTRRLLGGGGGARLGGIAYEVSLTYDLPRSTTVGSAMNALAHCAEALYVTGRNERAEQRALEGAALIATHLPRVVDAPRDRGERAALLRGAAAAGEALALAGLGLAHALAQALGGTFGLPHGAMNALTLPPALRFNGPLAPEALARFGAAIGAPGDPVGRVEQLAALGGFGRLGDFGLPRSALAEVASTAASRAGNRNNPRPATVDEIEQMLGSIY
jgi:maleylacetate reductase